LVHFVIAGPPQGALSPYRLEEVNELFLDSGLLSPIFFKW
jgi:hypothetical protein